MIAIELLHGADLLLTDPHASSAGVWPRASALLARQALETALWELWLLRAPGMEWCSAQAQLLCLPEYVRDREVAERAAHAWTSLSRICHNHAYELLPTAAELRVLLDTTRDLIAALAADRAG